MESKPMTENTTRKRVKVYKLNDEGEWDDAGTGHVSVVHLQVGVFFKTFFPFLLWLHLHLLSF